MSSHLAKYPDQYIYQLPVYNGFIYTGKGSIFTFKPAYFHSNVKRTQGISSQINIYYIGPDEKITLSTRAISVILEYYNNKYKVWLQTGEVYILPRILKVDPLIRKMFDGNKDDYTMAYDMIDHTKFKNQ